MLVHVIHRGLDLGTLDSGEQSLPFGLVVLDGVSVGAGVGD